MALLPEQLPWYRYCAENEINPLDDEAFDRWTTDLLDKLVAAIEAHDRWAESLSDEENRRRRLGPNEGVVPTERLEEATHALALAVDMPDMKLIAATQEQRRAGHDIRTAILVSVDEYEKGRQ